MRYSHDEWETEKNARYSIQIVLTNPDVNRYQFGQIKLVTTAIEPMMKKKDLQFYYCVYRNENDDKSDE